MRTAVSLLAFLSVIALGACGGGGTPPPRTPAESVEVPHSQLADDDAFRPTYGTAELSKALIAERGAEATGERLVAELEARDSSPATDDELGVARADLAVRRRFIAALEACEATGEHCPPRLDDPAWAYDPDPDGPLPPPKLDAKLRFDLEDWRLIASELHGRACACRTIACVDSLGVAIDALETRPMPEVQSDDAATLSITRARECLFWLRGKALARRGPDARAPDDDR